MYPLLFLQPETQRVLLPVSCLTTGLGGWTPYGIISSSALNHAAGRHRCRATIVFDIIVEIFLIALSRKKISPTPEGQVYLSFCFDDIDVVRRDPWCGCTDGI